MTTLDRWQRQDDGFPVDEYFEAVVAALGERGVAIEAHARNEDWDFAVELDKSGYTSGPLAHWELISVAWRVNEECEPTHADDFDGLGWYWVPFRRYGDALGVTTHEFGLPLLAEPDQVADAVHRLLATGR